ncbi:MAG: undecaprenyldiphospho-muramoylpentapeptide beta-N-acetylglucosaminyltransferase [Vicingaceae bacterium]
MKVIISGGGTGGHIFPALAIADALKGKDPSIDILFVGASGKMEMEKVLLAGYKIIGLPIRGIQRKLSLKNLLVPFLLIKSLYISRKTIKSFQPDVAVGVGGYASAALLYMASRMGIKTLIQEQNSYPGLTNRILGKRVDRICVAFKGLDRYFPKSKIVLLGNPIRADILSCKAKSPESLSHFDLNDRKKVILAVGGSLGARTINNCMLKLMPKLDEMDAQLIWQCGKGQAELLKEKVNSKGYKSVKLHPFIHRMDLAYAASDIVVSRSGALAVSEIMSLKKPSILIPSPHVAEDHQTKNAKALTDEGASILLTDAEAEEKIVAVLEDLLNSSKKMDELIKKLEQVFSNSKASEDLATEITKLAQNAA